ncbi:M48 family metalloprotease [Thermopolyspora sp. NPDC052614]|uniref:M48 family metalloprotease n=1 Tax=Thermopolyspora sp. NPDC052614 TaxID=3155682 RepID=UPI003438E0F1
MSESMVPEPAARLAGAVGGVVVVAVAAGEEGQASMEIDCTGTTPLITVSGDLAAVPARLYGVAAHEAAHCVLGHTDRRRRWWRLAAAGAAWAGVGAGSAALVTGASMLPAVAAAVVSVTCLLIGAALGRRAEYAADAHAVRLLEAAGVPGRQAVAAALAAIPAESAWYRAGGWLVDGHPLRAARLRRIAGGA